MKIPPAFLAVCALAAGCATPPMELHPKTPDLALSAADKRPQRIAVVVSDPMPYSFLYQGAGTYSRDMTADIRAGGFPLERELSRIGADTFSQAYAQVVVLRELPQPGQYDAVVTLSIGRVLMKEHVVLTGETCDLTADWEMSVLDRKNKAVLNQKGVSSSHNFAWSAFNPGPGFAKGIDASMSVILNELAVQWAADLRSLDLGPRR